MKSLAFVASLVLAGCDVGTFGPDGAGGDDTVCADRAATILPGHVHAAGGGTNAGNSCIEANCHGIPPATNAPQYQFAGTLYKADGTTANGGATIRIKNSAGTIAKTVTDDGGNFFVLTNTLSNPFPANTSATACPSLTAMTGTLAAGQGSCNGTAACHDANRRMTLAD